MFFLYAQGIHIHLASTVFTPLSPHSLPVVADSIYSLSL